jgi:hypothetical protein
LNVVVHVASLVVVLHAELHFNDSDFGGMPLDEGVNPLEIFLPESGDFPFDGFNAFHDAFPD